MGDPPKVRPVLSFPRCLLPLSRQDIAFCPSPTCGLPIQVRLVHIVRRGRRSSLAIERRPSLHLPLRRMRRLRRPRRPTTSAPHVPLLDCALARERVCDGRPTCPTHLRTPLPYLYNQLQCTCAPIYTHGGDVQPSSPPPSLCPMAHGVVTGRTSSNERAAA